jgi:hypothetical protein
MSNQRIGGLCLLAENLGMEKTLRSEGESRRHRRGAHVHGSLEKVARGRGRRPPANFAKERSC